MWDALLRICEYAGILVAGTLGIIGTVTETRKEDRLTRWGKMALRVGIVGFATALLAQIARDVKGSDESLKMTLRNEAQLHEIRRAVTRIDGMSVYATYALPLREHFSELAQSLEQRLNTLLSSTDDIVSPEDDAGYSVQVVNAAGKSGRVRGGFLSDPEFSALSGFIETTYMIVSIRKPPIDDTHLTMTMVGPGGADLELRLRRGQIALWYNMTTGELNVRRNIATVDSDDITSSGRVESLEDLSRVSVFVRWVVSHAEQPGATEFARKLREIAGLEFLMFTVNHQSFTFVHQDMQRASDELLGPFCMLTFPDTSYERRYRR